MERARDKPLSIYKQFKVSAMSQVHLSVAVNDNEALVKVSGRATFECCEDLKKFCNKMLELGKSPLVFEMKDCKGMDSTFMGTLTQFSLTAMKKKSVIEMRNIGEDNKKNLESIGLIKMFTFSDTEESDADFEELQKSEVSQDQHQENVLNAHEVLIDVHEPNRAEFQDIVTFLKENPE